MAVGDVPDIAPRDDVTLVPVLLTHRAQALIVGCELSYFLLRNLAYSAGRGLRTGECVVGASLAAEQRLGDR